ncbi:hypothetical protein KIN20_026315 [Parelaphostrongylus tenuis]|uniref:Uncharacterized protein n=1 Tax=Parelaphostrongylus tenuis TaxID=148309 RepID=A0AAD5MZH0_PARTN|nr:hypothetical protein KIN20_026315 [Parelaphostrongylus tenuis]
MEEDDRLKPSDLKKTRRVKTLAELKLLSTPRAANLIGKGKYGQTPEAAKDAVHF